MTLSTDGEPQNVTVARRYLAAFDNREDIAVIAQFYHPDVVQVEYPNAINPMGGRSDLKDLLERLPRGREVLSAERYEIVNAMAAGDSVSMELLWSGTLAVPVGERLPAGSVMRAHIAMFLEFRGGLIIGQRNYDCHQPW